MTILPYTPPPPPTGLGWEIDTLRQMRSMRDDGLITAADYGRAFALLDKAVGVPCWRCGVGVAALQAGGRKLCAPCYGEVG